jgi:aspartyl-tRNA(Asn)/glutamyl-tRNA(Gln) amidotransferase subunit B
MRGKEGAADYRYFPEPDIPPVTLDDETLAKYSQIPELPDQKRERYMKDLGINAYDAGVLTAEPELAEFFETLIEHKATPKMAVSWMSTELMGRLNKAGLSIEASPVSALKLSELIVRIEDGTISGKAGKDVLDYLMENDVAVDGAIDKLGLKQISDDGAIIAMIDEIMAANPGQVEAYRGGKEALLGFFVGQVMKASKGSANPAVVNKLLKEKLA